jgi:DNA-binding transcriptional ArsR family regulator
MITSPDTLSTTLAAVSNPTRRAILDRLALGDATVTELAAPFAMTLPAISKHLGVLERAGLIERGRDAQRRPCRLRTDRLKEAAAWMDAQRALWEERFDRLEAHLKRVQAGPAADAKPTPKPTPKPTSRPLERQTPPETTP